jgi:hypothetical protein
VGRTTRASAATTVFLLSPAYCGGRRAAILMHARSAAATAQALAAGTLTLGQAFAFMSGLYFRGKLAYAERFGRPLVITPTRGLLEPGRPFTRELLREFAAGDVSVESAVYRAALERDTRALVAGLDSATQVVLLGSVASGKYVDVLLPLVGDRLRYPLEFAGRGDMSRGGLLLRSAASGVELAYGPLTAGERPRGPRPPKLDPATRVAVSLGHDATREPDDGDAGVVDLALGPGKAGAERLGAVLDCRLRPRPRVHRRSSS